MISSIASAGPAIIANSPNCQARFTFTGDSLFPGGVEKTADPEKFTSLLSDVETKLFGRYDDSAIVYPGHGKDTTLGAERPHLQEWRERGW